MNKWYFISFGTLALVAIIVVKFVLPNLALLEMGRNLTSGDPERIAQAIDFESLRRSLLEQYKTNKPRRAKPKPGAAGEPGEEDDEGEGAEGEGAEGETAEDGKQPDGQGQAAEGAAGAEGGQAAADADQPPVTLPVPVENSTLGEVLDPLLSEEARQDARVQAMLNDALSPDGIERLLNGEMTQYNDLARQVFPPHLVDMAMQMRPADARALLQNVRDEPGPDGTRIMSVTMPNNGGEVQVTLRQNGASYQIVDLKIPPR